MFYRIFAFLLALGAGHALSAAIVIGTVQDAHDQSPLVMASVHILELEWGTLTDENGQFYLPDLAPGTYTLECRYLNYEVLRQSVALEDTLALTLSLQPAVLNLSEVVIARNASPRQTLHRISALDLQLQPLASAQEALRAVPGLFIAQHAGGGKAEQIFLRGFDIDHGTDINLQVDGMPVNMVSHAHGQGYSDLHFLIPELIERIEVGLGPYDSRYGNFATAGQVHFRTLRRLKQHQVSLETGRFGHLRGLAMIRLSPQASNQQAYAAIEGVSGRGYFESPQGYRRLNLWGYIESPLGEKSKLQASVGHFRSRWTASGQIPLRAIEQGLISRWGAIDDTEGGQTSRSHLNLQFNTQFNPATSLKQQAYWINYDFTLYSNFTFFLENPQLGDQIRQREQRHILGYRGQLESVHRLAGLNGRSEIGWELRHDRVADNELSQTWQRSQVLNRLAYGDVIETQAALYVDETLSLNQAWSLQFGLRYDRFQFGYRDFIEGNSHLQQQSKGILSPKLNLQFTPSEHLQFYIKTGSGYHSNDSRVIIAQEARAILPRAIGSDVGMVWKARPSLLIQSAVWGLWLDQEFVYVGDAGIVEPSGRSLRLGADLSIRWQMLPAWYANLDLNLTQPRALGVAKASAYLPLAPGFSSTGGLQYHSQKSGFRASLQYRWLGDRPANEDYSLTADGYFLLDAVVRYQVGPVTFHLTGENLLNRLWREAQFETTSRLRGEDAAVTEVHFTPGAPISVRGGVSVQW